MPDPDEYTLFEFLSEPDFQTDVPFWTRQGNDFEFEDFEKPEPLLEPQPVVGAGVL